MVERWARVLAIAVAGVMVAGPAFAQSGSSGSGGNTTAPQMGTQQPQSGSTSDAKPDAATTDKSDASRGGTVGSVPSDRTKADKSGAMKSRAAGARTEQVRAAQQGLKDKGHDPGAIDGVMGPKTQAALRDFQKAEGIQATGRLDAETMSKLGVAGTSGRTSGTDAGAPAASPKTGAESSSAPGSSSTGAAGSSDMSKDKGGLQDTK